MMRSGLQKASKKLTFMCPGPTTIFILEIFNPDKLMIYLGK